MSTEIIIKGKNAPGNDPSKVDGIGARFARMPYDIYNRINSIPEFDWILESPYPGLPNWGIGKFIELNPQFFVSNFEKHNQIKEYSRYVFNKDGTVFDLKTMQWVKAGMKGRHSGK